MIKWLVKVSVIIKRTIVQTVLVFLTLYVDFILSCLLCSPSNLILD